MVDLKSLDFIKKLDVWVSHELKEIHLTNCMSVCDQLIKREENDPFLKRMITGDEKWIIYNNVSRKRSWNRRSEAPERQAKAEIHQKKVMLSMWWNWKRPFSTSYFQRTKRLIPMFVSSCRN